MFENVRAKNKFYCFMLAALYHFSFGQFAVAIVKIASQPES